MTFDDLRDQWKRANEPALSPERREAVLVGVCRRIERWHSAILRRDIIETVVAVLGLVLLTPAILYFYWSNWIAITGLVIIVVSSVYINYKLHHTRLRGRSKRLDLSLRDYLEQEVAAVERQIELLRTVAWWYITPLFVGCVIAYYGMTGSVAESAWYAAGCVVLGLILYWLNQWGLAKKFVPQRDGLKELLSELENGDEE